jgi:hypothetical protein
MALKEDQDYVIVKRAAMFDGSRFNQQAGNLIATKNRLIFNVIDHADGMEKIGSLGESKHEDEYRNTGKLKDEIHDLKVSGKDVKDSWNESKAEFAKLKLFGQYADEVRKIANECSLLQEFENKVAAMLPGCDKSFNISNTDIFQVKTGLFSGLQIHLNDGNAFKFGPQGKGKIKKMIGK